MILRGGLIENINYFRGGQGNRYYMSSFDVHSQHVLRHPDLLPMIDVHVAGDNTAVIIAPKTRSAKILVARLRVCEGGRDIIEVVFSFLDGR